jgi:toxin CcdB
MAVARFDVYPHPDALLRKATPFLVDVQNNFVSHIATRVVIPMRPSRLFGLQLKDLNPVYEIAGQSVVLDTAALAAFPVAGLKNPVANLSAQSTELVNAMDTLFGAF